MKDSADESAVGERRTYLDENSQRVSDYHPGGIAPFPDRAVRVHHVYERQTPG